MSEPARLSLSMSPDLSRLQTALARLDAMDLPAVAKVELQAAQVALLGLCATDDLVDRAVFDALLDMAGPEMAGPLITQMATDLRVVSGELTLALATHDWSSVRAQTHVLAAIAGAAAGAHGLAAAAHRLNALAHHQDGSAIAEEGGRVLSGLTDMIAFVERAHLTRQGA